MPPWSYNFKALVTFRKSEVFFSTKTISLGIFRKHLVLKSRNLNKFFRQLSSG